MKIFFTFTNSVDPDEMQHYAAFHLGLHCLQKYLFRGFPNSKGYPLFHQYYFLFWICCLLLYSSALQTRFYHGSKHYKCHKKKNHNNFQMCNNVYKYKNLMTKFES